MSASNTKLHQTKSSAAVVVMGRRCAVAAGVLGLLAASCWLSVGVLAGLRELPRDLDTAVAAVAAAAVAVVLVVWSAGAAVTALALAARAAGRTSATLEALSTAMTPVLLRRAVAAALGVAVLGGAAAPALAAPPGATPVAAAVAAVTAGGATAAPDLTWPAAPPPHRTQDRAQGQDRSDRRHPEPPVTTEVVVHRGDTLWRIAERSLPAGASASDVAASWPRWYRANRAVVGADPDLLLPGQRLVAPEAGS